MVAPNTQTWPDLPYVTLDTDELAGQGQLHDCPKDRAVRVSRVMALLVQDGEVQVALQQRSESVNNPLKWDSTAEGYVDLLLPDQKEIVEDYRVAARREFLEETGIELVGSSSFDDELHLIAHYLYKNDRSVAPEWTKLYAFFYNENRHGALKPNPEETEQFAWHTPDYITEWVESAPEDFEPGFPESWRRFIRSPELARLILTSASQSTEPDDSF